MKFDYKEFTSPKSAITIINYVESLKQVSLLQLQISGSLHKITWQESTKKNKQDVKTKSH
jgi:hypothetical protein